MHPNQDELFAASEGDRWYERNKKALEDFDPESDLPLRILELYGLRPRSVAEIGASNGFRVAALARRAGVRAVAIEPSTAAIVDGRRRHPEVEFVQGRAAEVPVREEFDLVIVNFVFHWVDRAHLLRSAAEVDRLVRDGGHLLIGDFLPSNRLKVRYHHLATDKVYTYKQDYAAVFAASGLYHPVCLLTGAHAAGGPRDGSTEDDRIGVWLLRKDLGGHYVPRTLTT